MTLSRLRAGLLAFGLQLVIHVRAVQPGSLWFMDLTSPRVDVNVAIEERTVLLEDSFRHPKLQIFICCIWEYLLLF